MTAERIGIRQARKRYAIAFVPWWKKALVSRFRMFLKNKHAFQCYEKRLKFEKRCLERGKSPFLDFRRPGTLAQRSWA